jgi:hypothetical protein
LVILGATLASDVVYVALNWVPKVPLFAMTAGTHGALALMVLCSGFVTMSMRFAVVSGQIELGSANAVRRDLLVLWNLSLLMALLGWLGFAIGISLARVPVGALAILSTLLLPAATIGYSGTVVVLATRLLRV